MHFPSKPLDENVELETFSRACSNAEPVSVECVYNGIAPNLQKENELESETKFVLSNHKIDAVLQWLRETCYADPDYPVSVVSSIYYDTRQLTHIEEKANSDYLKTKVRLRWYDRSDDTVSDGTAFAEVKHRIGSCRSKIRIRTMLNAEQLSAACLESSELLIMDTILKKNGIILDNPVFPVFTIKYHRQRFIEKITHSRVCLDYGIHVPKVNRTLLPKMMVGCLNQSVFELKGNSGRMPCLLQPLVGLGCKKSSFSKYFACYCQLAEGSRRHLP